MKKARPAANPPAAAKTARSVPPALPPVTLKEKAFTLSAGMVIGLALLKFGNPIIFDRMIRPPVNLAEFIFTPWPISWGYLLLAGAGAAALPFVRPSFRKEQWPIALLGVWLFWQFLSSTRTIDRPLTSATLMHFVSCGVCFVLGWWALARVRVTGWFWTPILLGFFYVLLTGYEQHHGGLDMMRKSFYEQPNWQMYPPEYLAKMQSTRIFSTLVYPNALAGVILLFLPISLWKIFELTLRWPRVARGVLIGLFAYLGLSCLYWTGSKGGWLIALGMAAAGLLRLKFSRKLKVALVTLGVTLGLLVFFVRFSGYFQRGATSVSARFIYWSAAFETARKNPVFGTGPGTFAISFRPIKPPDAEMAKLAHNDYLEQASDSGFVGALAFAGFIGGSLLALYRQSAFKGWAFFLLWLGLLGWAAQAVIEFGLYIPALAWPVFLFFGWLWGKPEDAPMNGST